MNTLHPRALVIFSTFALLLLTLSPLILHAQPNPPPITDRDITSISAKLKK